MAGLNNLDEQKLKNRNFINNEIRLLKENCAQNGVSPVKTKKAAELFIKNPNSSKLTFILCVMSVTILLFSMVISFESTHRVLCATYRQIYILILPVLDWRRFHDVGCIVRNPYIEQIERPVLEDCQICSNVSSVPILHTVSLDDVANDYLQKELPVVIVSSQGLREITRIIPKTPGKITMADIVELYLEDEILRLYSCCEFDSNIDIPTRNHRAFLIGVRDGKYTQYYAHWQNCFVEAARLFRRAYRRPPYLPSTVELRDTNWLFVSSQSQYTKPIQMPIEDDVVILLQLTGDIDIILTPKDICGDTCKTLKFTLSKHSTFMMTDLLYTVEYIPSSSDTAITVGLGGTFQP